MKRFVKHWGWVPIFLAMILILTAGAGMANAGGGKGKTEHYGSLQPQHRAKLDHLLALPIAHHKKYEASAKAPDDKTRLRKKLSKMDRIIQIHSDREEPTVDVLIKAVDEKRLVKNPKIQISKVHPGDGCVYITATIAVGDLEKIADDQDVIYIEASKVLYPELSDTTGLINADDVWCGGVTGWSEGAITGQGVVVGIMEPDLVRLDHETFKSGGVNRISSVSIDGEPYNSVAEVPSGQIYDDHATHVAGIAAGNGVGTNPNAPKGIAYGAEILVAKMNSCLDDLDWMISKAAGKPLVVNMSFGFPLGPHDGSTMVEQALNSKITGNVVVIKSAGNERETPSSRFPHFKGTVPDTADQYIEIEFEIATIQDIRSRLNDPTINSNEVAVELWSESIDQFDIKVLDNDPVFPDPSNILYYQGGMASFTGYNGDNDDTIYFYNHGNCNWEDHNYKNPPGPPNVIAVFFDGGADNIVEKGTYRIRLSPHTQGSGGIVNGYHDSKYSVKGGFVDGDHYQTITVPGNAEKVITVAAHYKGDLGDSCIFSSLGPLRTDDAGTVSKPEIAAPGDESLANNDGILSATAFGHAYFEKKAGTSQAAPHVTGAIALLMQSFPDLTADEVKTILKDSAGLIPDGDGGTKAPGLEDNKYWGAGKLDILAAYRYMVGYTPTGWIIKAFKSGYTSNQDQKGLPVKEVDRNWHGLQMQELTNGALVLVPGANSAYWIGKGIWNVWIDDNYNGYNVNGLLGRPLGEEFKDPANNNYPTVRFQNGKIYWANSQPNFDPPLEQLEQSIPSMPTLTNPPNGVNPYNVKFSWSASSCPNCGNVTYNLEVHDKNNNTVFKADDEIGMIASLSHTLINRLKPNETYYWAVFPKSQSGVYNNDVGTWPQFKTGFAPSLPPQKAINPKPTNGASNVSRDIDLQWTNGGYATSYRIYLGKTSVLTEANYKVIQDETTFDPGPLEYNQDYFWRIDSLNNGMKATGDVWKFTTGPEPLTKPLKATSPSPINGATNQSITRQLSWTGGGGATSYDVYFNGSYIRNQPATETNYNPGALSGNTPYTWRIDSKNSAGTTTGDIWHFTTANTINVEDDLVVYEFDKKSPPIYANPDCVITVNPNIDAEYKIKNVGDQPITVEQLALAVHDSNGNIVCNMAHLENGNPRFYFNVVLNPNVPMYFAYSVNCMKEPGNYKLIAKAKVNSIWYHLSEREFEVLEAPYQGSPPLKVSNPTPKNGEAITFPDADIAWGASPDALYYNVYFGTIPSLGDNELVKRQTTDQHYDPGTLEYKTYYWRVDSINSAGTTPGDTWHFTLLTTSTSPSGQLSVQYKRDEDKFYLNYSVNQYTDTMKIYYSFDNGYTWTNIFERTNITDIRSGNQPVTVPDSSNHDEIRFKLEAINTASGASWVSTEIYLSYDPVPPYVEKSTEMPYPPNLNNLGTRSLVNQVTLGWRKVIDSHNNDNVNYYEVQYADNGSFSGATIVNVGNPATGANIYETINYTVTGLQDGNTYYFRVNATNNVGNSGWSVVRSILIDVEDMPYFETTYQEPANGAINVNKQPTLRWRAHDNDGDELDYYVSYGTSPDDLKYNPRAFNSDHKGQNSFSFAEEWHEPLAPDTTYYWQILVKEDGRYSDYYGGEYIKSPIWSFTTTATGSDLAITNISHTDPILPATKVVFQATVKNLGSETATYRNIACSYIKGGSESKFWTGWGYMSGNLAPGAEEVVDVTVGFRDTLWEKDGVVYDNILVSGNSQIRFYFQFEDPQDVNTSNNEKIYDIYYEDAGGPTVNRFELWEFCSMYGTIPCNYEEFWARMGQELDIIVNAQDDVMVKQAVFQYRYHATDGWTELHVQNNADPDINYTYSWAIPTNISTTNDAQVRVLLYDDKNNETELLSNPFSIYSNRIDASVEPTTNQFKVGETLNFNIVNDSDNTIDNIKVRLKHGGISETIYSEYNASGITISNPYSWAIPDHNRYYSNYCYLELTIDDVRGNSKTVMSSEFSIDANTTLLSPFNESKIIYNEEFNFPVGALYTEQAYKVQFVRMDSANVAHTVVNHEYRYFQDTGTGVNVDTLVSQSNSYYITYDKATDTVSSKILIANKNYEVIDFDLYNGIPYAMLKSRDSKERYYYTFLNGGSFVTPIVFENEFVPGIGSYTKINAVTDGSMTLCDPNRHVLHNGYLWDLDIIGSTIYRYSYSNGTIGTRTGVSITNNAGSVTSYDIRPVSSGNFIYFIAPSTSKLVRINTSTLVVDAFSMPYTVGSNPQTFKTALAAKDGKLFLFGNGKIYTFDSPNFTLRGDIQYTFNSNTVNYSTNWSKVDIVRTAVSETNVVLVMEGNFWTTAKPTADFYEILLMNPTTYAITKSIVKLKGSINSILNYEVGSYQSSDYYDIEYIGDNTIVIGHSKEYSNDSTLHNYYSYFNVLDLDTGDVIPLGILALKATMSNLSIHYNGGIIYTIVENVQTGKSESFRISLNNMNYRPNRMSDLQLLKFNNELYAAWPKGRPYDGTWNSSENKLNDLVGRKNKYRKIIPTLGTINEFTVDYFHGYLNIIDDTLSASYYRQIFSLNNDMSINQALHNQGCCGDPIEMKNYGSTYVAGLSAYNSGKTDHTLYKEDLTTSIFDTFSSWNEIATFEGNQAICVGYGFDSNDGIQVITKIDLATNEKHSIAVGGYSSDNSRNYQRVDINENMYVAISWDNFIAVGDLSGDIVPPAAEFLNTGGQVAAGTNLTLEWQANDNINELTNVDLYKTVNGVETLLQTFTDPAVDSYIYNVNEGEAEEIVFRIVACDSSNNVSEDTVSYTIVSPVTINSFIVDKSVVQLNENLIFTWDASGYRSSTVFSISKRKAGDAAWSQYFQTTGETSHTIPVEEFVGEYEFKIDAGDASLQLAHTVTVEGELVEFDYNLFWPKTNGYYAEQRFVDLTWALEYDLTSPVVFSVYIKPEGSPNYILETTTSECSYRYILPEGVNTFEWKVEANYTGALYTSNTYQSQIDMIGLSDVLSVQLLDNNTDTPRVVINFSAVANANEYWILRRNNTGSYQQIGIATTTTYSDETVEFGERYEYAVQANISKILGQTGNPQTIDVQIKPIDSISFQNMDNELLAENQITIEIVPEPLDAYEKYEVLIGKDPDSLSLYCISRSRTINIAGLENNTTYFVFVYALDDKNYRVLNTPAVLTFTTPHEEIPASPDNLIGTVNPLEDVELSWADNSTNESGFEVMRRDGEEGDFISLFITQSPLFTDTNINRGCNYYYAVRAFNSAGYSALSNIVLIDASSFPDMDYGDAPDPTYATLLANDGARHSVLAGYYLGAGIDAEPDGQPDANALGDDNNGDADEDGVTFDTLIGAGQNMGLTVTAADVGYLDVWIDFNADGDWADAGEQVFISEPLFAGSNNLAVAIPGGAALGQTFARFRFSSTGGLSYCGHADDGEVEDYVIEILENLEDTDGDGEPDITDGCPADPAKTDSGICGCGVVDTDTDGDGTADCIDECPADFGKTEPGTCGCGVTDTDSDGDGTPDCNETGEDLIDLGDAPDPTYPTLLANNGARHVIVPGYYLGNAVDFESDGVPNVNAKGDDNSGTDDEDGVVFETGMVPCMQVPIIITAAGDGYIDAWVDFNLDGDWADAGEQIFISQAVTTGANALSFTVPCNAILGQAFIRFRFSSTGGLSYTGLAPDGEVEDYKVRILEGAEFEFNGDYRSDILWRNTATGKTDFWFIDRVSNIGSAGLGTVATVWNIEGAGDFDGDGQSDILWRNTSTGDILVSLMDGNTIAASATVFRGVSSDFQIYGVGDFDGDGMADILWRNMNFADATNGGKTFISLMDGFDVKGSAFVAGKVPSEWEIQGVGDFDGDGNDDVLWRNMNFADPNAGKSYLWLMNGLTIRASAFPGGCVPLTWEIQGISDFDGDEKEDVLWRHTDDSVSSEVGKWIMWFMNGLGIRKSSYVKDSNNFVLQTSLIWELVSLGDYNIDGMADMLWRRTDNGAVRNCLMNGNIINRSGALGTRAVGEWMIVK